MRILIVDDDEMNCLGIQKWITAMNLPKVKHIDIAFSAEAALDFAEIHPVQILLTDIQMVEMNGLDLIVKMKECYPHIISLIITAYASFPYAHRAIELGVKSFLLKPFSKSQLQSSLNECLPLVLPEDDVDDTDDPVEFAKTYVREHIREDINMAEIANNLDISYAYFSRIFRQATGETFQEYLLREKMQEAANLLVKGKSVGETADIMGYSSQQNFSRTFFSVFGVRPGEYKKKKT